MRVLDLAGLELRRYLASRIARLALVSVALIPLLYGALYLWAFWDPYGRLDRMPVALVDQDQTVTVDGTRTHAGADLQAQLLASDAFDWKVTDAETARKGVLDGTYYLSLTIPADFSARLASADADTPEQAQLQVQTNDSNNYLAGQLSRFVFSEIRGAAGRGATHTYLDRIYLGFGTVGTQLDQAASGASRLASGAHSASSGAQRLASGTSTAVSGAAALTQGAQQAASGAHDLSAGLARLRASTRALPGSTAGLAAGADTLHSGLARLASSTASLPAQTSALDTGAARLRAGATRLADRTTALPSQTARLSAGVDQLATGVRGGDTLAGGVLGLAQTLRAAAAGGDPAAQAIVASADFQTLVAGASQLHGSSAAVGQVVAGAHRLAAAAPALTSGARTLSAGSATLAAGTHRLAAAAPTLTSGVGQLRTGADLLAAGTARLASGTGDLTTGLVRLSDGASQLTGGVSALEAGSRTLSGKLAQGARALPTADSTVTDRRTTMMSDPVGLTNDRVHRIDDYGTGFTPYFVPLALWIGALLIWFFVRPASTRALSSGTAPWRVALGGYLPGAAVGVVQTAAVLLVLHSALGLDAVHPVALWGFAVFSSLVFVAILQFVVKALGTAGRLAGLVLLMLQLTSCAGTFPIETAPRFFQVINPILPMTYVTNGLRIVISGGSWGTLGRDVLVLGCYGVVALVLTGWSSARSTVWTVRGLHPELSM